MYRQNQFNGNNRSTRNNGNFGYNQNSGFNQNSGYRNNGYQQPAKRQRNDSHVDLSVLKLMSDSFVKDQQEREMENQFEKISEKFVAAMKVQSKVPEISSTNNSSSSMSGPDSASPSHDSTVLPMLSLIMSQMADVKSMLLTHASKLESVTNKVDNFCSAPSSLGGSSSTSSSSMSSSNAAQIFPISSSVGPNQVGFPIPNSGITETYINNFASLVDSSSNDMSDSIRVLYFKHLAHLEQICKGVNQKTLRDFLKKAGLPTPGGNWFVTIFRKIVAVFRVVNNIAVLTDLE